MAWQRQRLAEAEVAGLPSSDVYKYIKNGVTLIICNKFVAHLNRSEAKCLTVTVHFLSYDSLRKGHQTPVM